MVIELGKSGGLLHGLDDDSEESAMNDLAIAKRFEVLGNAPIMG